MSTSLTLIDRRKRMANMNTSSVNRPNIDNIKSPISLNTMETFLSNINNNVDINFFGTQIFDKYSIFADDNQDKPKISAEQKADDKKKIVVDMKYEKGIKSATLQFNGQNYDINIAENTKEGNFELDLAEGENKVILTVVGSDGATQVLEKSFTVQ